MSISISRMRMIRAVGGRIFRGTARLLNKNEYNHWLAVAARFARRRGEAEDLLHDSLLAAVQARRTNLDDPQTRAWFAGLVRNKAAMTARTAGRRRKREAAVLPPAEEPPPQPALAAADEGTYQAIRSLPASARIVAILALHGLTRQEIAYVLDLAPEALRQRLTTLRKRWCALSEDAREDALDRAQRQRTVGQELECGLIRRALLAFLREQPGVGTHDPDGHLIIFERPARSAKSRTATPRQRDGKHSEEV
jgi:RNA polymerase sigma-70 factor (ECF subfamily)